MADVTLETLEAVEELEAKIGARRNSIRRMPFRAGGIISTADQQYSKISSIYGYYAGRKSISDCFNSPSGSKAQIG